jgi:hypothetical protein
MGRRRSSVLPRSGQASVTEGDWGASALPLDPPFWRRSLLPGVADRGAQTWMI